jgi:hypothetical protein
VEAIVMVQGIVSQFAIKRFGCKRKQDNLRASVNPKDFGGSCESLFHGSLTFLGGFDHDDYTCLNIS